MMNKYYVYAYLDPRKPGKHDYDGYCFTHLPVYIGKGQGRRCTSHMLPSHLKIHNHRSATFKQILNDGEYPIIVKISENLTHEESLELEIDMICSIGRRNLNIGPLTNHTNGGEGTCGTVPSKEARRRMSEAQLGPKNHAYGKKKSPEIVQKMIEARPRGNKHFLFGKNLPEETKRRMSKKMSGKNHPNYGKKRSIETKRRISEARNGNYYWIIQNPDNKIFKVKSITKFCKEHGLDTSSMRCVDRGKFAHYHGWTCKRYKGRGQP